MEISLKRDGLNLHGILEGTTTIENDHVAILMHGFQDNLGYDDSSILYSISHYLNQKGIPTLRFDFNGAGKSDGNFENMTIFNEILDGMKIIDYARTTMHSERIYLIGHSQGGVVASMLAGYYPDIITKLVLLAPAATLKDDAKKGICQNSHYDPNHIPSIVNVNGIAVGGDYFRIAQLLPIYETAQQFTNPVLLIHGLSDHIVSPKASKKYDEILPNSKLHLIHGENHMFDGSKKEEIVRLVEEFIS